MEKTITKTVPNFMTAEISSKKPKKKKAPQEMEKLLASKEAKAIPKIGDLIEGEIINKTKNEVHLDIDGLTTGVIRGYELLDELGEHVKLKKGDRISAVVLDLENEDGEMELSFRQAGHERAWKNLRDFMEKGKIFSVQIIDANKGGLMVKFGQLVGFLPSSQLSSEFYPKVRDGEKGKILEKLKQLINKNLRVKIIDIIEEEEKIVVSEKAATRETQEKSAAAYKLGDKIKGKITDLTSFGAFVKLGDYLEGLVHISEIGWQKISHPKDALKIGQPVEAMVIGIEGPKIFLSIKRLTEDPWKEAIKKYKSGQKVKGKVFKITSYGLFVELEKDIYGLAHISELSPESIKSPSQVAKVGDVLEFKISAIEPEDHRIGLSLRALKEENHTQLAAP